MMESSLLNLVWWYFEIEIMFENQTRKCFQPNFSHMWSSYRHVDTDDADDDIFAEDDDNDGDSDS